MSDVQSNIQINIDTSNALASLKALQSQISLFQREMANSSAANALSAKNLQRGLIDDINATGKFTASIQNIKTTTESFTQSLEKNKLSMGEYFRYSLASTQQFGKNFSTEMATVDKVARERVKDLQTQYISLGRNANGALQSIAVRPLALDLQDAGTKAAIAAQKTQIFNQLLTQGSTNLLNFGKNTQWAGRQLMVGFTIPLSIFGATAAKAFMEIDQQVTNFKRVYGDLNTPSSETNAMIKQIKDLGMEYTKYGIKLSDTIALSAKVAAMGKTGNDLLASTSAANKLSALGGIDQQKALDTTISLTNTFGIASKDLANNIDFLNAVENQTLLNIDDLTTAIPKAGPVVQQLGGNVKDLAFFMTAMREGGINASEGANALKSGLASLINPSTAASKMLSSLGINLKQIVQNDKGDLKKLVIDFATSLDKLDPTTRAQAIEKLFGKFQFARISTLLQNVTKDGGQAAEVLKLAGMSATDLASISGKELGQIQQSTTFQFKEAIAKFQAAIAPVGEQFLKLITPIIKFGTKILDMFSGMSDSAKSFVTTLLFVVGGIAPVFIMTFGLVANAIANGVKGFMFLRNIFKGSIKDTTTLGEQTQYMSAEQIQASAVAASLDQVHSKLIQTFTSEKTAVDALTVAYERGVAAQSRFGGWGGSPVAPAKQVKKYAQGIGIVPGSGNQDSEPAMLTPGEAVIPAPMVKRYGKLINGMVAGNIPGYALGKKGMGQGDQFAHVTEMDTMALGDFMKAVEESGVVLSKGVQNWLKDLIKLGLETQIRVGSGLGFAQKGKLNTDMRNGGSVSTKEFLADFEPRGGEKWAQTLALTKTKMKDVAGELEIYDKAIVQGIKDWQELSGKTTITSEEFAQIEKSVRNNILEPTGKLKVALDKAEMSLHDVRANVSEQYAASKGFSVQPMMSRTRPGEVSSRKQLVDPEGNPSMLSVQGNRKFGTTIFGGITLDEIKTGAKTMVDEFGKDLIAEAEVQSPSKKTKKATKGMVDGVVKALEDGKDQVTQTGRKSRRATSNGIISPASEQVDTQTTMVSGKSRRATRPGDLETRQAAQAAQLAKIEEQRIVDGEAMAAKNAKLAASIDGTIKKVSIFSGALGGMSMISGMFGAQLGTFGQVVQNVSGALFALSLITDALVTKEKIELAVGIAKDTAQGVSAAVKGFAEAGSVAKGLGGVLSVVNKGFGSMIMGLLGLDAGIEIAGVALSSLLGPIALGIGAVIALGFAIKWLADNARKEAEKVSGLGDAAHMAADKLDSLGKVFGFTASNTDLSKQVGTTQQTAKTVSATDKALSGKYGANGDQSFKDAFEPQIMGIAGATKNQAEAALKSMAVQLANSGAPQDAVNGIVNAMAKAAGRKDLNLDFAKVDLGLGTEKGKQALTDSVTDAQKRITSVFSKNKDALKIAVAPTTYSRFGATDQVALAKNSMDKGSQKDLAIGTGEVATVIQSLANGFAAGTVKAKDLVSQVGSIVGSIKSLGPAAKAIVMPDLVKKLNLTKTMKGIKDLDAQLAIIQATASGVTIDPKILKTLRNAAPGTKEYANAMQQLADATANTAVATEKKNTAEQQSADLTAAQTSIADKIDGLQKQMTAYNDLTTAGIDAANAVQFATDATIQSGLAAAKAAGPEAYGKFIASLKELAKESDAWSKTQSSAGSAQKSPMQQALDNLKQQKTAILDHAKAYTALIKAKFSAADAEKYASDATYASAIAQTKSASAVKNLVNKLKDLEKVASSNAIKNFMSSLTQTGVNDALVLKLNASLAKLGGTATEINQITSDTSFMEAYRNGKVTAKDLAAALQKIKDNAKIELQIQLSTPEGMSQYVSDAMSKVQEAFSAQETSITLKYDAKMADNNKTIRDANDLIAGIQYKVDQYQAGLDQISTKETDINTLYDARSAALDKIQKTNDVIARQQKSQLTIADAITQGDISAAAKAIQDKQAQDAQDAMQAQKDSLDTARQTALAGITDSQGRTRLQLETAIKTLNDQITQITNDQLKPAEERNRLLEIAKQSEIDSITVLGKNKTEWDNIQSSIDMAKVNSKEYFDAISSIVNAKDNPTKAEKSMVDQLISSWKNAAAAVTAYNAAKTAADAKAAAAPTAKASTAKTPTPATTTDYTASAAALQALVSGGISNLTTSQAKLLNVTLPSASTNSGGGGSTMKYYSAGGLVPNYFASGGFARGTDTVPAMLTPGEFVMNPMAVKKFGADKFSAMNAGIDQGNANGSGSVYNSYQVTVSTSSAASPQEIANTVMGKIRSVDAQRVRGVRH